MSRITLIAPLDPRLKRRINHDPKSKEYAYPRRAADPSTLKSVRHHSAIPTLDQGQIGSCTANAGTKNLSYPPLWVSAVQAVLSTTDTAANEKYAVDLYSEETRNDPFAGEYPPTDTGSDGLTCAKRLKVRGLIAGYQHAFDLNTALTALAERPVMIGTKWLQNMFNVDAFGHINVSGVEAGGHEYLLDEIDVERKRVWIQNSWGTDWGIGGRAWMTWDELASLLADQGDVTILIPITEPAPQPTPPGPVNPNPPAPVPPAPVSGLTQQEKDFLNAATAFLGRKPWYYRGFQASLKNFMSYLKSKQG